MAYDPCPRCKGLVIDSVEWEPHCMQCGWIDFGNVPEQPEPGKNVGGNPGPPGPPKRPCQKCGMDISWRTLASTHCPTCAVDFANERRRK